MQRSEAMTPGAIFTIGHSNHKSAAFLHLLQDFSIQVIVDVRSAPYSRYVPQFNKKELALLLEQQGVKYIFMGNVIGGKPSDPALSNEHGQVDYEKLAKTEVFQQGIDRLLKGITDGWRVALLCAEEDPAKCHRHWLIAKELELNRGIAVWHLRANGQKERAKGLLGGAFAQMGLFS